ncbi:hypothetical protein P154DRAFT_104298 [Amniculicola lignicola CBS 123094]|uniref:Uncharacterized protein n=1 Tax=Amniculicola lignicola CBS 123094 TaxID=1392246 RepID=A0A6A5WP90_9PLEO|nr:hypothetical protein P154DRAFT_104298 [Amniculicola lignicola CBS 123094]
MYLPQARCRYYKSGTGRTSSDTNPPSTATNHWCRGLQVMFPHSPCSTAIRPEIVLDEGYLGLNGHSPKLFHNFCTGQVGSLNRMWPCRTLDWKRSTTSFLFSRLGRIRAASARHLANPLSTLVSETCLDADRAVNSSHDCHGLFFPQRYRWRTLCAIMVCAR